MSRYIWFDPPSGWRYGFPVAVDTKSENHLSGLIDALYPDTVLTSLCRSWEATRDEFIADCDRQIDMLKQLGRTDE